jgi:hypothetical protein
LGRSQIAVRSGLNEGFEGLGLDRRRETVRRNRLLENVIEIARRAPLADHVDDRAQTGFGYALALEQFHKGAIGRGGIVGSSGGCD